MKKLKWFVLCGLMIILISGCSSSGGKFEEINFQEYQKLIENKESFVLEMLRDDCSHCKDLKPKLQKVIKEYDITIKTINLNSLSKEDEKAFKSIVGTNGTPTIIFYKNGEEASVATRIVGDIPREKIIQKFKDNGIIK